MLHVTNGDSIAEVLTEASVTGEIVPWRDVLHDGPVPAGLDDERLAAVRARFIAERGWGEFNAVARELWLRDEQLGRALAKKQPVALWFEDDLYDVLQLIQVLERISRAGLPPPLRVRLAWLPREPLDPRAVEPLLAVADPITPDQLECAGRAWSAFRASDPGALMQGDFSAIPNLPETIERHFEQFPAVGDGLDRSERALLDAVAIGAHTPAQAFQVAQQREERPFLGDTTAFWYLARMASSPAPLLELSARGLVVTELGGAVLRGEVDHPVECGDEWDRWRGGVRLRGPAPAWRWDPVGRALVRTAAERAPASAK